MSRTGKNQPRLSARLAMAAADIAVYGRLLAAQRRADLHSREPGFLARMRPVPTGEP